MNPPSKQPVENNENIYNIGQDKFDIGNNQSTMHKLVYIS